MNDDVAPLQVADGPLRLRAPDPKPNPTPVDLVHELHTALYGSSWARPETPKEVWEMCLAEVRRRSDALHKLTVLAQLKEQP